MGIIFIDKFPLLLHNLFLFIKNYCIYASQYKYIADTILVFYCAKTIHTPTIHSKQFMSYSRITDTAINIAIVMDVSRLS